MRSSSPLVVLALVALVTSPGQAQDRGPRSHQVSSASSPDGLSFSHDGQVLLESASVPAAIVLDDGRVRLYYVDASTTPENANCAESSDAGRSFEVLGCRIERRSGTKAVDPSIVRLPDGRYRLYYYAPVGQNPDAPGSHTIYAAISSDGVRFEEERAVFSYPGLVDPDVFWSGREWLMFVFGAGQGTLMARSADGLDFSYLGPLPMPNWGTTAPVRLPDGRLRLYAFDQPAATFVASFVSDDGLAWTREPGSRLLAPDGYQLTDPYVVRLADGTWKMFYKRSVRQGPAAAR